LRTAISGYFTTYYFTTTRTVFNCVPLLQAVGRPFSQCSNNTQSMFLSPLYGRPATNRTCSSTMMSMIRRARLALFSQTDRPTTETTVLIRVDISVNSCTRTRVHGDRDRESIVGDVPYARIRVDHHEQRVKRQLLACTNCSKTHVPDHLPP